jgi:hypothetical protein
MTFERYLEAIYYDAEREKSVINRGLYLNNQVVGALNTLLGGAVATVPDRDLQALMGVVFLPWSQPQGGGSYQALLTADLALPLDDTLQQLNDLYGFCDLYFRIQERHIADHNDALAHTLSGWGAVPNPAILFWNEQERSLMLGPRLDRPNYAGVQKLLKQGSGLQLALGSADQTRRFLEDPANRRILTQELDRFMSSSDAVIAVMGICDNIMAVVQQRLPDFTLPARTLGLLGTATEGG